MSFRGLGITDETIRRLDGLTHLEHLVLMVSRGPHTGTVTDAGLKHLKAFSGLRTLVLMGCEISDSGLQHLKDLKELRTLELVGTRVSDAGVMQLRELVHLERLNVAGSRAVTEKGVQELRRALPHLVASGYLTAEQTVESMLVKLGGHVSPGGFYLVNSRVTDDDLRYIGGQTQLKMLCLGFTSVSDAGIAHLEA